jgi:hypothetical protein
MYVSDYFNDNFGILLAFVFLAGFIGDILIHIGTGIKFPFGKPWFAQGLIPYYKSMVIKNNKFSGWVLSGLAGGVACIISLFFVELFLYAN